MPPSAATPRDLVLAIDASRDPCEPITSGAGISTGAVARGSAGDRLAETAATMFGFPRLSVPFVAEGGALVTDGVHNALEKLHGA